MEHIVLDSVRLHYARLCSSISVDKSGVFEEKNVLLSNDPGFYFEINYLHTYRRWNNVGKSQG